MTQYTFTSKELQLMENLYREGLSAQEIKDTLVLKQTVRSIQRRMKKIGLVRTVKEAFRNAMRRGRIEFYFKKQKEHKKRKTLSPKLRYQVLIRDKICQLCGSNINLEIDHKDENPSNNTIENLQVLCHECNQGKSLNNRFPSQ